jgi:hypothetical protein
MRQKGFNEQNEEIDVEFNELSSKLASKSQGDKKIAAKAQALDMNASEAQRSAAVKYLIQNKGYAELRDVQANMDTEEYAKNTGKYFNEMKALSPNLTDPKREFQPETISAGNLVSMDPQALRDLGAHMAATGQKIDPTIVQNALASTSADLTTDKSRIINGF